MNGEAIRAQPKPTPGVVRRRQRRLEQDRQLRQARSFVKKRDGGKCRACGKRGDHVHHVRYRSRGGKHDLMNLVLLCVRCHQDVHARLLRPVLGNDKGRSIRFVREGSGG